MTESNTTTPPNEAPAPAPPTDERTALKQRAEKAEKDRDEYLNLAKLSADAVLLLLNDILDFSKIEAGKLELEIIDFNLRDCLENAIKSLALRAHEKGLELALDVPPGVPEKLIGDPGRLRQLIVNLAGNAIKFTARGEVLCTSRSATPPAPKPACSSPSQTPASAFPAINSERFSSPSRKPTAP